MNNFYLFFQLEEQPKQLSQKEDVAALKKQIYDLSMVRITFHPQKYISSSTTRHDPAVYRCSGDGEKLILQ